MNIKNIISYSIIFILGTIAGVVISISYLGSSTANTIQLMALENRAEWAKKSYLAYKNEPPEVAIWALNSWREILEGDREIFLNDTKYEMSIESDIILAYGRLALAHKEKGNVDQYSQHLEKALKIASHLYPSKFSTKEQIVEYVAVYDNHK